jgi:hypothetical protein
VLAPAVEGSLRVVGVSRTIAAAAVLGRRTPPSPVAAREAERLVAAAFRLHLLLPGQCLARSIVQWVLQHEAGARLVVGVRRGETARAPDLDAHAWVELRGVKPEGAEQHVEIAAWTAGAGSSVGSPP